MNEDHTDEHTDPPGDAPSDPLSALALASAEHNADLKADAAYRAPAGRRAGSLALLALVVCTSLACAYLAVAAILSMAMGAPFVSYQLTDEGTRIHGWGLGAILAVLAFITANAANRRRARMLRRPKATN